MRVPADAPVSAPGDYTLVGLPEHFVFPVQVFGFDSDRSSQTLIAEVLDTARQWGRREVAWWITALTRPSDLVSTLVDAGAVLAETIDVLALDLSVQLPDLGDLAGTTARVVRTAQDARVYRDVNAAGWESDLASDEEIRQWVDDATTGRKVRVVGTVGGEPAACGGLTVDSDVAHLWGAATTPSTRGRGGYRAVLRERLILARDAGAELAIVRARAGTSGPILRHIGFGVYGQELAYRLSV